MRWVEVRLYGHWGIPLFASGKVHSLDSDWLLAQWMDILVCIYTSLLQLWKWLAIELRLLLLQVSSPVLESHGGVDMLLNIGYVMDNVDLTYQGEKHVVFLAILAVARMVIWETWNKGLYDDAKFSHRDLILFFRHQLGVKN